MNLRHLCLGLAIWIGSGIALADEPPGGYAAVYRLTFNDELVGEAHFNLSIDGERYELEAYTLPAGKMDTQRQEILEISRGWLSTEGVRPETYDYSIQTDGKLDLINLGFNWDSALLQIHSGKENREITLKPGSQDHLSYLLQIRNMLQRGQVQIALYLVNPEATEAMVLEHRGQEQIEVGDTSYTTERVERFSPDNTIQRRLWLAPELDYLPVRIEQSWDQGVVSMRLVSHRRQ